MTELLLAQAMDGGTLVSWLIGAVIIGAIIGVVIIALNKFGIPIPQWVWQIAGIVLVAVVAIVAIKFLVSIW
jgi:hypothetical protein